MRWHESLLLCLVLVTAHASSAAAHKMPRVFRRMHSDAVRQTQSLAGDLRVAFQSILPRKMVTVTHTVTSFVFASVPTTGSTYCKTKTKSSDNDTPCPTGAIGGPVTGGNSGIRTSTRPSGSANNTQSPWKSLKSYTGNDFFKEWDFNVGHDPTHGTVTYVDASTAKAEGLAKVDPEGNFIMSVETTPIVSGGRKSVRITSQLDFTGGLVILDALHMPDGCGTWPAFWTCGPNWPQGGEIDIIEGVNVNTHNQATIHTARGCRLPTSSSHSLNMMGKVVGGIDCSSADSGNAGCGVTDSSSVSYGAGFNNNGGGAYAMLWVPTGISVHFFPRESIPDDIAAGAPQPQGWGTPLANWPADQCDPFKFFYKHSIIFDITLCGDWAGHVWNEACGGLTKVATCPEYVIKNGGAFAEAYWKIKSVAVYQSD